jgi:hypothetical protein
MTLSVNGLFHILFRVLGNHIRTSTRYIWISTRLLLSNVVIRSRINIIMLNTTFDIKSVNAFNLILAFDCDYL